jgi:hypothetical protein
MAGLNAVLRCGFVLVAFAVGLVAKNAPAQEKLTPAKPTLAASLPSGVLGYVEFSGLDSVIGRVQASEYLKTLLTSPQGQAIQKSPQYRKAQAGRKILESQLGMDLWTVGKQLIGGRVAVGLYGKPGQSKPPVVALVQAADPQVLAKLRERLEPLLELVSDQIVTSEVDGGVHLIDVGGKAFFALHEKWIAATNDRDLLTKTLALNAGKGKSSLAQDEAFQSMTRLMGADHEGRLFINTHALIEAAGGRTEMRKKMDNPVGSLLLGGIIEMGTRSPYGGLTLDIEEEQFVLTAGVAGNPRVLGETYAPFFANPPETGTRPMPQPPELIGGFTLYRDFGEWYRRREELLQPQILPGFDKFESGLGNLLPGKDFSEDVLPLIGNNITLVAAPQDYSHLDGEPGVKLPGFAVIIELAQPKEGAELFQLFFQTFSSILNIQAGQQGRQPWILESETYKDEKITFGRYLQKPSGKRLPLVFNFRPASARVGDQFIISSSLGLCRQLIDDLNKPASKNRVNKNLNLQFHFGPFTDILEANQEFFQAQRIQNGRSPQQAQQDVAILLKALRYLKTLDLSTRVSGDSFQAQFKGSWK